MHNQLNYSYYNNNMPPIIFFPNNQLKQIIDKRRKHLSSTDMTKRLPYIRYYIET